MAGPSPEPAHAASPSPRSSRDLDILRSLSRRIDARDPGAHNNLGVVFFNKGLYEDAIVEFERALDRDPGLELAARNLELALAHTGLGARRVAELLRDGAGKGEAQTRHRLARLYYANGDLESAEREWNGLLARTPGDAAAHLWLARTALKREDAETAHAHLKHALSRAENDAQLLARVGEMCMRAGAADDARYALERALELDESLPDAHAQLAELYRQAGEEARAATLEDAAPKEQAGGPVASLSLERHGVLRPMADAAGDAPSIARATLAHYNRGLALRRDGDYDGAGAAFDAALAAGEDRFVVRQALGELALLRADSTDAAAIYATLVEEEPASPKLWNERGVAAHQQGALAEAEEAYRRAIALDATYALAWNNLGVVRHHAGDPPEAERSFRQAIAHGRAPAEVWRNLGLMLTRHTRHEQASDAFRRALELEPNSATAWSGMGAVLMEMGRAEEARNALMRAVDADEDLAEARYQLAFALSALGDYRGALRETKRAIELDPYYPAPRFRLLIDVQFEEARLLAPELEVTEVVHPGEGVESFDFSEGALDFVFGELSAGTPKGAAETADAGALNVAQASADGAERAEILLMLGELFLQRGLAGEANERFEAVLAGSDVGAEDRRRAALGRVRGLLMLERFDVARNAAAELAHADARDAEALQLLGEALLRNGEPDAAAEVLQRATAESPDDAALHAALGAAQWRAGHAGVAEQTLRRALALNPAAATARVTLGEILEQSGRAEAAAAEYRAALDTIPSFGGAALALAALEDARGDARAALRVLVELLELDPYHLDALNELGQMLARAGRYTDARTAFERVLRFDSGNADAAAALASLTASAER